MTKREPLQVNAYEQGERPRGQDQTFQAPHVVEAGEDVIIARNGKEVARLTAITVCDTIVMTLEELRARTGTSPSHHSSRRSE